MTSGSTCSSYSSLCSSLCILMGPTWGVCVMSRMRGGSGGGGGGWYSPGTMSFGGGSTVSALACTHIAPTSPATLSCFPASSLLIPALVGSFCCSRLLSSDGGGVGVCDATCPSWDRLDGGIGCGLMERDDGGCACVAAVTTASRSDVAGFRLERRFAAWYLSCLMASSSSASFLSCSLRALNFSHTSHSSSPFLPNPCDVASLLLEVGFRRRE
jgi:hypothetical protein